MTSDHGAKFLLDEAEAVQLHHGDGLELEDGRVVVVIAAPEALLEVRAADPNHLLRLAWHLGNRHLSTAIDGERLLIRYDRVIADMLVRLGATVAQVEAPFDPEGGAYGGPALGHAHGHDHPDHDHHHSHDHG